MVLRGRPLAAPTFIDHTMPTKNSRTRIVSGDSPQKNCPGYSQDSENSIIIGEAIASPQLSLYKRRKFVYNKASCNETYYMQLICEFQ